MSPKSAQVVKLAHTAITHYYTHTFNVSIARDTSFQITREAFDRENEKALMSLGIFAETQVGLE